VTGGAGLFPGVGAYGGQQIGDTVANLRVDQAWGSAQVMGALHEVNATYYSLTTATAASAPAVGNGHPSDAWGWAAGAGVKILTPFVSQGDYLQTQFNVTQGALRYIFNTPNTNYGATNGSLQTLGVLSDGVYGGTLASGNTTSVQLTSAWGFNAAYEHFWVPNFRTSVYGGYDKVTYNGSANAMLCAGAGFGAGAGTASVANAGCNMDWSTWFIGSRTQWDVNKNFYLGVDVLYETMKSATTGTGGTAGLGTVGTTNFGLGSANSVENSSNAWLFRFRAHRDFLP